MEAFERLEKGVAGGQLAFPTEAREENVAELKDFPATFVAGQGEELQPGAIELSHRNVEKIHKQLWRAGEEQMKKWVIPCAGQNADKARRLIKEVLGKCATCANTRKCRPDLGPED